MASPLWASIATHEDTLRMEITQWIIGQGDVRSWADNWLGDALHGPLPCNVKLFVGEAFTLIDHLMPFIPHLLKQELRLIWI